MNLRLVYLALTVIGFFLPMIYTLPWLLKHGLDINLGFSEMFANGVASAVAVDAALSFVVLCVLTFTEGARLQMRNLWMPPVGALFFGICFGLPLFLYMRQVALEKQTA